MKFGKMKKFSLQINVVKNSMILIVAHVSCLFFLRWINSHTSEIVPLKYL